MSDCPLCKTKFADLNFVAMRDVMEQICNAMSGLTLDEKKRVLLTLMEFYRHG